jgi:hypothetical protein
MEWPDHKPSSLGLSPTFQGCADVSDNRDTSRNLGLGFPFPHRLHNILNFSKARLDASRHCGCRPMRAASLHEIMVRRVQREGVGVVFDLLGKGQRETRVSPAKPRSAYILMMTEILRHPEQ